MAKKRVTSKNVVSDKITKIVSKSATVQGRPGFTREGQQKRIGTIPPFRARSVKTLQKVDIAKGITTPDAKTIEQKTGQITPPTRAVTAHLQPQVPPTSGKNVRVTKAPDPTSGGGIRNPFSRKSRVGRGRGNNKRYG